MHKLRGLANYACVVLKRHTRVSRTYGIRARYPLMQTRRTQKRITHVWTRRAISQTYHTHMFTRNWSRITTHAHTHTHRIKREPDIARHNKCNKRDELCGTQTDSKWLNMCDWFVPINNHVRAVQIAVQSGAQLFRYATPPITFNTHVICAQTWNWLAHSGARVRPVCRSHVRALDALRAANRMPPHSSELYATFVFSLSPVEFSGFSLAHILIVSDVMSAMWLISSDGFRG